MSTPQPPYDQGGPPGGAPGNGQYGQQFPENGHYGQPAPHYGQPVPQYGQPAPQYGQPAPGFGPPPPPQHPNYGMMPPGGVPPRKKGMPKALSAVLSVLMIVGVGIGVRLVVRGLFSDSDSTSTASTPLTGSQTPEVSVAPVKQKWAATIKAGMCVHATEAGGELSMTERGCEAPDANYTVGKVSTIKCDILDQSHYQVLTETDSFTKFTTNFCLVPNLVVGKCYNADPDVSVEAYPTPVSCTDTSVPERVKLTSVVKGSTDSAKCDPESDSSYQFTEPQQLFCLATQ